MTPTPSGASKLLVVDDHAGMRELFKLNMEREGFQVVEAEDGVAGLAKAKTQKPQLMVIDLMMPKLNGMDMLDRMKGEGLGHIPVIVMTAYFDAYAEKQVRGRANVVDYVRKPLKFQDVAARIRAVLTPPKR